MGTMRYPRRDMGAQRQNVAEAFSTLRLTTTMKDPIVCQLTLLAYVRSVSLESPNDLRSSSPR